MSVKLLEDYFTSGASERLLSDIRGTSSCPIAYTRETACGDDRFLELCGCLARDSHPERYAGTHLISTSISQLPSTEVRLPLLSTILEAQ